MASVPNVVLKWNVSPKGPTGKTCSLAICSVSVKRFLHYYQPIYNIPHELFSSNTLFAEKIGKAVGGLIDGKQNKTVWCQI